MNVLSRRLFMMNTSFITRNASSNTDTLIVNKQEHITTFGINRPEKRNCINSETAEKLKDAIEEFENDDNAYVGILYGIGGNFCAGYDLSELSEDGEANGDVTFNKPTGYMGPTLRHIKKPMVAAVSGYAVAGGLELALMCDLRVVEENAVMGVYCRRFGVPLIDGGTVRLQAYVGLSRALDYILTGRSIPAKEAFEVGLANRIVAVGTGFGQAVQLAQSLVKFPQKCMNADRASAYNSAYCEVYNDLLKYETEHGIPVLAEESVQGAQKFVAGIGRHGKFHNLSERDKPEWEKQEDKLQNKL